MFLSYALHDFFVEKTGVLLNAMYMPRELSVQVAPQTMASQSPCRSSSMATLTATSDEAHAASTSQFRPSKLKTCNSPGHYVSEKPREGVKTPLRKVRLVLVHDLSDVALRHTSLAQNFLYDGVVESGVELVGGLEAAPDAEDASDVSLLAVAGVDAGVLERLLHLEQGQRLVDVTVLHLEHVQPELSRVKVEVGDEPTPGAVDLVLGRLVRVVVRGHVDTVRRDLLQVVQAFANHLPGLAHVLAAGQDARVADNGDVLLLLLAREGGHGGNR